MDAQDWVEGLLDERELIAHWRGVTPTCALNCRKKSDIDRNPHMSAIASSLFFLSRSSSQALSIRPRSISLWNEVPVALRNRISAVLREQSKSANKSCAEMPEQASFLMRSSASSTCASLTLSLRVD